MGLKTYHPIVNFIYFLFTITFSCVFMHPVFLIVSLFSALFSSLILTEKRNNKRKLLYLLPMCCLMALVNPLFNHQGATILAYFPSGNPLTLESIVYGLFAAVMCVCVILWFSCFSAVMTSDKIMYLFSKTLPSLSLVFSMTLRFVPRFLGQLKIVADTKRGMGQSPNKTNLILRAKHGLSILSITTTWALEEALDMADSMKARGYGLPKRTAFSVFRFARRDAKMLLFITLLSVYIIIGAVLGAVKFSYFPFLNGTDISLFSISVMFFYLVLCLLPVILKFKEVRKWNALNSKM